MADGFSRVVSKTSNGDLVLMDVAASIQVNRRKHEVATQNFQALASHVDRPGSPLEDKVLLIYPSGSFAIGAAILGKAKADQHDVDAVLELDLPAGTEPHEVLRLLFEAINGEEGSRYHGKVEINSRCVTVTYEDRRTVDLMPVVRLEALPERVAVLFHHKPGGKSYHKHVNPKGFSEHFKRHVARSAFFEDAYAKRRQLLLERAETETMPDHEELENKAPRVVALQLLKRFLTKAYQRGELRGLRKPPSVVGAALALKAGPSSDSLLEELDAVARRFRAEVVAAGRLGRRVRVYNPAWDESHQEPDEFTDRWPSLDDYDREQRLFVGAIDRLLGGLAQLRLGYLSRPELFALVEDLFGESVKNAVVESRSRGLAIATAAGGVSVGPDGAVMETGSGSGQSAWRSDFYGGAV